MGKSVKIKTALLHKMAEHVLSHGLNSASLRPLAMAARTSDRMLIYHFGSKDALIADLLLHLAVDLKTRLDSALPPVRAASNGRYLEDVVGLLRKSPFNRYMRVWLDIVSTASNGSQSHKAIGQKMIEGYLEWLGSRLPVGSADPDATLAVVFTIIEGVLVMDAVGQGKLADKAVKHAFRG